MKTLPFYLNETGKFYDYFTGGEHFGKPGTFAGPFEGECYVGSSIFRTSIDKLTGERCWSCIKA